jgi:hypothetical protein
VDPLERELSALVLDSEQARAVYADVLLSQGDPRGELLVAARALAEATTGRSAARLQVVAALKALAKWLDEKVPEGKPWRAADLRGVTSEHVGFMSHEGGVLHRLRIGATQTGPPTASLFDAVPTLTTIVVPATVSKRLADGRLQTAPRSLFEVVGAAALERVRALELALPVRRADGLASYVDQPEGLGRVSGEPVQLRLTNGEVDVSSLAGCLQRWSRASMVWLDRVRVVPDEAFVVDRDEGVVPHLRLTETPLPIPIAKALAASRALEAVERLELKDWSVGPAAIEAMLAATPRLRHLAIIRSPLGRELADVLESSGRLQALESLDLSGCRLGVSGVRALLVAGRALGRVSLRFNQLNETELPSLAQVDRWPAEVKFEEVTFGPAAQQALSEVARVHGLKMALNGCGTTLKR